MIEVLCEIKVISLCPQRVDEIVDELKSLTCYCTTDIFGCPRFRIDDNTEWDTEELEPNTSASGEICVYGGVQDGDENYFRSEVREIAEYFGAKYDGAYVYR